MFLRFIVIAVAGAIFFSVIKTPVLAVTKYYCGGTVSPTSPIAFTPFTVSFGIDNLYDQDCSSGHCHLFFCQTGGGASDGNGCFLGAQYYCAPDSALQYQNHLLTYQKTETLSDQWNYWITVNSGKNNGNTDCQASPNDGVCYNPLVFTVQPANPQCDSSVFSFTSKSGSGAPKEQDVQITVDLTKTHGFYPGSSYSKSFLVTDQSNAVVKRQDSLSVNSSYQLMSGSNTSFTIDLSQQTSGTYNALFRYSATGFSDKDYCSTQFTISPNGSGQNPSQATFSLCSQTQDAPINPGGDCGGAVAGGTRDYDKCCDCFQNNKNGVWTALGCIHTDQPQSIIQDLLKVGLGIAGGVILLSILMGAFLLTTSAGDTKKVEEAQQMISGAIIGFLFIIFSVILLQFIGVSILHLPGFGS